MSAAYVSALNSCGFCEDAHAMVAIAFGFEKDLIDHLMADLDAAPIEPRLKPVLRYCRKLTEAPRQVTDADAAAVYDAGWTEAHLHAAVMITGIFNLMNRLCEGAGLTLGKDMSVEDDEHAEFVRGLDIPNLIQYTGYVRSEPDR
ncbi:MAG: carboxymuconolactone decarboxylase family protein [Maricaulaceae bacterium]